MESVEKLSWMVKHYSSNANAIKDYDVLRYETAFLKGLKKKCNGDKAMFERELRQHMMYYFWSKAEWELIIRVEAERVFLSPWCGCRCPEAVAIDVTEEEGFDWLKFAEAHISRDNEAKIDVYDQVAFRWEEFVNYCWNTRLKWEREKK